MFVSLLFYYYELGLMIILFDKLTLHLISTWDRIKKKLDDDSQCNLQASKPTGNTYCEFSSLPL